MPKYCVRDDGAVYPYSPELAKNSRFKVVDELPTQHVQSIETARQLRADRIASAQRLRVEQERRHEELREKMLQRRQRAATPAIDPEQSAEAQRQTDEFTGNVNSLAPAAAGTFVISTATKEELMAFAKQHFPDARIHPNIGAEKLREKIAELTGATTQG